MDQKKIGNFLKELRLSKNLTQEELAEKFFVSSRSISRWETGVNLPDISLLIELADFYEVDVREIIEGEYFNKMNDNEKDIALKVANYANDKNEKSYKKIVKCGVLALISFTIAVLLMALNANDNSYLNFFSGFFIGVGIGGTIYITLYASDLLQKIHEIKWLKITLKVLCLLVGIALITIAITMTWF